MNVGGPCTHLKPLFVLTHVVVTFFHSFTHTNNLQVNKIIIRHQIRTEYKIAYPYLYNSRPRSVRIGPYHAPSTMYLKPEDPDLPTFHFNPVINPIPASKRKKRHQSSDDVSYKRNEMEEDDEEDDDFALPNGFAAPFADVSLWSCGSIVLMFVFFYPNFNIYLSLSTGTTIQ